MKLSVRVTAIILFFVMLISFVGCDNGNSSIDSTEITTPESESSPDPSQIDVEIKLFDPAAPDDHYAIIRSEKADTEVCSAASFIWKTMTGLSGFNTYSIVEDWVQQGGTVDSDDKEILVGLTNRIESIEESEKIPTHLDYTITVTENKIVILANTSARLTEAVEKFVSGIEKKDDGTVVYSGKQFYLGAYEYPLAETLMGGQKLSELKIVVTKDATERQMKLAENLVPYLRDKTGVIPEIVIDTECTASGAEISIGKTNRKSGYADLASGEFSVSLEGSTMYVVSGSEGGYTTALGKICEFISETNVEKLSADFSEVCSGLSLDGKKVVFIGNSFIYYGGAVVTGGQQSLDTGWFYQICKANGENCQVYDFTYGGKDLNYIYSNYIKGRTFKGFDYLIFSEAGSNNSNTYPVMKATLECFEGSPKVIYLNHSYTVLNNHTAITSMFPAMRKDGVMIANWGQLVVDVANGRTKVPGSSLKFNKQSFIKNNGDSHHPNPLAGYITAQMAYCLITGKSAVGQMPDIYKIGDAITYGSSTKGFDAYISKHYKTVNDSNFKQVFASQADILGFQELIDQYIELYK